MTETFSFDDPLICEIRKLKENGEEISINVLQRKFRIGYLRAARLMVEVGLKPEKEYSFIRARRKRWLD